MSRRNTTIWIIVVLAIAIVGAVFATRRKPVVLRGAVLQADRDPNKQIPLANVQVSATNALGEAHAVSDASGSFSLTLPKGLRRKQPVRLQFRLKDYEPLNWDDFISDKVYIA
ncbi:MAG TPA: hypothetical protein VND65_02645 [Candidatus Binatia bacterium]|nr:hypothetical protein [Candidatus Binatia bacterium]